MIKFKKNLDFVFTCTQVYIEKTISQLNVSWNKREKSYWYFSPTKVYTNYKANHHFMWIGNFEQKQYYYRFKTS